MPSSAPCAVHPLAQTQGFGSETFQAPSLGRGASCASVAGPCGKSPHATKRHILTSDLIA